MTLQDFFDYVDTHPNISLYYFLGIPILALLISWISEPDSYMEPWNYIYTILIYAICIPGIFAVTLNVYFFFWERRSIMSASLPIQFFPILSMVASLLIIKRYINFDAIPGFDKLSGLMTIIAVIITLMWFLDRTQIYVFTRIPFVVIIALMISGILLIRYSLNKFIS